jgi:membrane protein DedA with SNARE-associated domain
MTLALLSLAAGTFISEDLACVSAGLLVQRGVIDPYSAVIACALGIFAGDLGLWGVGRAFGRAALQWAWVARHLDAERATRLSGWLDRNAARAIVASRFLPGARLPLYVIAGVLKMRGLLFALWALVAALVWTPVLVLGTARLGDAFVRQLSHSAQLGWVPLAAVAGLAWAGLRSARGLSRANG